MTYAKQSLLTAGAAVAVGLSVLTASPAQAAVQAAPLAGRYLPAPAGSTSSARDVGENGTVGGSVSDAAGIQQPTLWRGAQRVTLPIPPGTVSGDPPVVVEGWVSKVERTTAIGNAQLAQLPPGTLPIPAPLRWSNGAASAIPRQGYALVAKDLNLAGDALITELGIPPIATSPSRVQRADGTVYDTGIQGAAIDGQGRAVGYRTAGQVGVDFRQEAVRSDGTATTVLSRPEGRSTAANDAAEDGTVCGETFTATISGGPRPIIVRTERSPALWNPDGTRVDLPSLGAQSWCTQTAGRDVAIGQYLRADGSQGVVLWIRGRAFPVGPTAATPVAVNARGQVVGTSSASGVQYGFVADTRNWRRLTAPGGLNTEATDINGAGVVVGNAFARDAEGARTGQRAIRWVAGPTR
jgi:hypothetical protein